ncbi:SpoIIE family protein phosphatase [Labrenzia sp. R4_2]|uniref:PP2C family protein-serine/threonine phosphatase n=1 Tax=Labrenzia sp. R4_2 TaxID=2821107 RepID=UPI003369F351
MQTHNSLKTLDRFWLKFMDRPLVFAVVVLLALALLPVAVWMDLRTFSDQSLRSQAIDLDKAITEIRTYYARNVVGRVQSASGDIQPTHEYHERDGGIPIPATLSIELGDVIGDQGTLEYRFVSDLPFTEREPYELTAFEQKALADFRETRDPKDLEIGFTGSLFDRQVQIASPVYMGASCVACHNTHPESPKTDWVVGDIRGIQAITIDQPIAENLWSFKYLLTYFAGAGAFGIAFAGLQWRQAYRFHKMNGDLEAANSEISHLNEQLASENVRLGAEIEVARQIQMMVLPTQNELGEIDQLEVAAFMEPADEVGGDYYDVLQLGDRVKIGIGDVTGHGLESGVLMLMVQSVAVALQEQGPSDPKQFLVALNNAICRNIKRTKTDKHLTLCFLDIEHDKLTLTGQHEELILLRRSGAVETVDTLDLGFPVGLEDNISEFVRPLPMPFERGDTVVLYTDGVTEAENTKGEMYGLDRLIASTKDHGHKDAARMLEAMIADLRSHIGSAAIFDDITLLVARRR